MQHEFTQNEQRFKELLREGKFSEVLVHFKDILRNGKVFHISYVYYLAQAYLMLEDYEHAKTLVDDILKLNVVPPQAFMGFAEMFLSKQKFEEGFEILEKVFQRVQITDKNFLANLKNLIERNNLRIEKYPRISKFIVE